MTFSVLSLVNIILETKILIFLDLILYILYGKHSLRYLGPFLWNKLDKNITETSSLSRFKFHIRCRDLTELINGNNCSACVICTS